METLRPAVGTARAMTIYHHREKIALKLRNRGANLFRRARAARSQLAAGSAAGMTFNQNDLRRMGIA